MLQPVKHRVSFIVTSLSIHTPRYHALSRDNAGMSDPCVMMTAESVFKFKQTKFNISDDSAVYYRVISGISTHGVVYMYKQCCYTRNTMILNISLADKDISSGDIYYIYLKLLIQISIMNYSLSDSFMFST